MTFLLLFKSYVLLSCFVAMFFVIFEAGAFEVLGVAAAVNAMLPQTHFCFHFDRFFFHL